MDAGYFETRERALLGDAYDTLYTAPGAVARGITVNTLRCTPAQFAAISPFATAPSPFCEQALLLQDENERPGLSVYHHAGVFYVQEPSASAVAALLGVQPGDRVLDMCAAPGGKTSQLAAAMQGEGLLVANEYMPARAAVLRSNLERMGVQNAMIVQGDTSRLTKAFPHYFNKILVDAPCSGEGMFRKEAEALRQHTQALVEQCAALGADILDNAAACLAPGGTLVYSTCTFAPQEDEAQIGAFLQRHPDFALLPIECGFGASGEEARAAGFAAPVQYTRRIYPCHGGEGHFMALLQHTGAPQQAAAKPMKTQPMPPECARFLQALFPDLVGRKTYLNGETVYLLPQAEVPDGTKAKLHILQTGVQVGTVTKGRFVPAHHLFMAFGAQCTNKECLTAGDARTAAWLHGEEIEATTAQNGITAVLCDGFPIGFGKQSNGRIKNQYPKGLRSLK